MYLKLKGFYDSGNMKELKNGLSSLAKLLFRAKKRSESLRHLQGRFQKFKDFIKEKHKNTLNDKEKKIFVVSHSSFMTSGTDMTPYESETIQKFHPSCHSPKNCEIFSYKLFNN